MSALVDFSHKGQERQEQDFGKEEPSAAACEKNSKSLSSAVIGRIHSLG